MTNQIL